MSNKLVSIVMLAYNHEKFIAQAIEGVLMQQTNFDFELVIGEDFSPDKTRQICLDYEAKYPEKVRVLKREKNLGGGGQPNFIDCYKNTKDSKFIALCEGDDYWTSPHKLQKQVDFLEKNADFVICFHNTEIVQPPDPRWGNRGNYQLNDDLEKDIFMLDDLIGEDEIWFMATASVMYRRSAIGDLPGWFVNTKSGDIPLHILAARNGKIKYINEMMAAYRKHAGGQSLTDHKDDEAFLRNRIFMYQMIDRETDYKFHGRLEKNIARYYKMLLDSKQFEGNSWKQFTYAIKYLKMAKPSAKITKEVFRDYILPKFLLNFSRNIKRVLGIIPS
jgi:glycosyltransferase involved in cell wall biosynthesis